MQNLGESSTIRCFHTLSAIIISLWSCSGFIIGDDGFYKPVIKTIEGWTIKVDPELIKPENQELYEACTAALGNHLQRIKFVLAKPKVKQLQELPIWLEMDHPLENMQYHPNPGWLLRHGYDVGLAKHVHIPRAKRLLDRQQWAKHPYVILHELAHAYHDQVLGFDDPEIMATYELAKQGGGYEKVLAHNHQTVKHYGLTNHKEYFAESTEAYLGVNDFYPFVRSELKVHDPKMFSLLEKIWGELK